MMLYRSWQLCLSGVLTRSTRDLMSEMSDGSVKEYWKIKTFCWIWCRNYMLFRNICIQSGNVPNLKRQVMELMLQKEIITVSHCPALSKSPGSPHENIFQNIKWNFSGLVNDSGSSYGGWGKPVFLSRSKNALWLRIQAWHGKWNLALKWIWEFLLCSKI